MLRILVHHRSVAGERSIAADDDEAAQPERQHLTTRMAQRPRGQHGAHVYDPDDYGLDPQEVRGHFTPSFR